MTQKRITKTRPVAKAAGKEATRPLADDAPAVPARPAPQRRVPSRPIVVIVRGPITVDARAVATGDHVQTDPDTAARLIAAGYAVPLNPADQEVS